jgi:hypothetical protein
VNWIRPFLDVCGETIASHNNYAKDASQRNVDYLLRSSISVRTGNLAFTFDRLDSPLSVLCIFKNS